MYDLMVDIETLDTRPSAVVLSIGAVMFDRYTRQQGPTFYVELTNNLEVQTQAGRTLCPKTLVWWMNQSSDALKVFDHAEYSDERCAPRPALTRFVDFCTQNRARYIWAKDPDFDVIILRSLFETNAGELDFPFHYGASRAVRTVLDMPFAASNRKVRVQHNALADAVVQATDIQEAFQCLHLHTRSSASPAEPVSAKTPVLSSSHATSEAIGTVSQIP